MNTYQGDKEEKKEELEKLELAARESEQLYRFSVRHPEVRMNNAVKSIFRSYANGDELTESVLEEIYPILRDRGSLCARVDRSYRSLDRLGQQPGGSKRDRRGETSRTGSDPRGAGSSP